MELSNVHVCAYFFIPGGTSLITYYVPGNYEMSLVAEHFTHEMSSSQNIKDKSVRNSVQSSIKSIQQLLKTQPSFSPNNGFVVLAGETVQYI